MSLNSLTDKSLMGIIRELDKESSIHSYIIYTITIRQIYYNHVFDIIISFLSTIFQTYDITSCNHSYIPLYCPRNKRNRKEKKNQIKENRSKEKKIKIKCQSSSIL